MNNNYENEVLKYHKKKESNISKAKKKSKHKHQYKECLLQYKYNFKDNVFTDEEKEKKHTTLSSYCVICGKIGGQLENSIVIDYLQTKYINNKRKCRSVMDGEELYEKYHDRLPVFFVEDYWKDKYVNLEQKEKNKREYTKDNTLPIKPTTIKTKSKE